LKMLAAETALARYEAVRHRLPPVRRMGACEAVADLSALADRFDTFLLDAFGVLNIGEEAIPGVPDRIAALQSAGKRVMVVTNAASVPHAALVEKYARLGYHFAPQDVISSRDALLSQFRPDPDQNWGVMVPPELQDGALDGLPLTILSDDLSAYDRVDGVLMLGSSGWSDKHQSLLAQSLRRNPRPIWVGNPDIVAPRQNGFSVEPGYYAHDLADQLGIEPQFYGKPFSNIYNFAFTRVGRDIDPRRVLMVGDSLHTDILGAQTAGIASALVTGYGFLAGLDAQQEIARTGISPDFLLAKP